MEAICFGRMGTCVKDGKREGREKGVGRSVLEQRQGVSRTAVFLNILCPPNTSKRRGLGLACRRVCFQLSLFNFKEFELHFELREVNTAYTFLHVVMFFLKQGCYSVCVYNSPSHEN